MSTYPYYSSADFLEFLASHRILAIAGHQKISEHSALHTMSLQGIKMSGTTSDFPIGTGVNLDDALKTLAKSIAGKKIEPIGDSMTPGKPSKPTEVPARFGKYREDTITT